MKGSFGGSYGLGRNSGGGGGGFNGGGMMRTVGRVMRTRINGIQDPFPSSSSSSSKTSPTKKSTSPTKTRKNGALSKHGLSINNHNNNVSSNNCVTVPVSAAAWSSCPYIVPGGVVDGSCSYDDGGEIDDIDDDEWEYLEDYYDPVFGGVPSPHEVQHALFSLQQVLHPLPSSNFTSGEMLSDAHKELDQMSTASSLNRTSSMGSDRDWIEPSMRIYDQRLSPYCGWETVYDAFHLLQTEPSVQKMVVSLSSDKAVWDAVLNNETVREIRNSYLSAAETGPAIPNDNSDPSKTNSNVLKWIIDHMKGKLLEVIGNITQFVGDIFKPLGPDKTEDSHEFSDKLKSSFLLTIVVLLIVVVTRGTKA